MKSIKVKDYMTDYVLSFSPDMRVFNAIETLRQRDHPSAPVLDKEGNLVGMLSQWDCVQRMMHGSYFEEVGGRVQQFMVTDWVSASPGDDVVDVAETMVARQWHHTIPVLEGSKLVGVLSCSDILKMVYEFESGRQTA